MNVLPFSTEKVERVGTHECGGSYLFFLVGVLKECPLKKANRQLTKIAGIRKFASGPFLFLLPVLLGQKAFRYNRLCPFPLP